MNGLNQMANYNLSTSLAKSNIFDSASHATLLMKAEAENAVPGLAASAERWICARAANKLRS